MNSSATTDPKGAGLKATPSPSLLVRPGRFIGLGPNLRSRWLLWSLLIALLAGLLGLLAFLTGRYEASNVQSRLDAEVSAMAGDVRNGLNRNLRALQVLSGDRLAQWQMQSTELMQQRREIVRIEWRNE